MSLQAMVWALEAQDIAPTEKLLLIVLGNYCDPDSRCYPSHATLAKDSGLSERTVLTALASLETLGLISRQRRSRPDGSRTTDLITLLTAKFAGGGEIDRRTKPQMTAGGGETVSPHEPRTNLPVGTVRGTDVPLVETEGSDARKAFDGYNLMALRLGFSKATKLTASRRGHLNARLKECGGLLGWTEALLRVERSAFLSGNTPHRFSLTLDFLLQPQSFTRLMEGFYDHDRRPIELASPDLGRDRHQDRIRSLQRGAVAAIERRQARWGV